MNRFFVLQGLLIGSLVISNQAAYSETKKPSRKAFMLRIYRCELQDENNQSLLSEPFDLRAKQPVARTCNQNNFFYRLTVTPPSKVSSAVRVILSYQPDPKKIEGTEILIDRLHEPRFYDKVQTFYGRRSAGNNTGHLLQLACHFEATPTVPSLQNSIVKRSGTMALNDNNR